MSLHQNCGFLVVSSTVRAAATALVKCSVEDSTRSTGAGFCVLHKKRKKREDEHCAVEGAGPRELEFLPSSLGGSCKWS